MGTRVKAPKGREGDFVNVSQGLHVAVCVDVLDIWQEPRPPKFAKPGQSKMIDKTRLVWEVAEEVDTEGRPLIVSQFYTASLFERAKLRQHLESWRGRPFSQQEEDDFELEVLVGIPCQLQVVHKTTDSGTYANVHAIVKLGKGQTAPKPSGHYVRVRDREDEDGEGNGSSEPEADHTAAEDDIPF